MGNIRENILSNHMKIGIKENKIFYPITRKLG
jgi:hypothetical protein